MVRDWQEIAGGAQSGVRRGIRSTAARFAPGLLRPGTVRRDHHGTVEQRDSPPWRKPFLEEPRWARLQGKQNRPATSW
jgi:hypothetical protein